MSTLFNRLIGRLESTSWDLPYRARLVGGRTEEWTAISPEVVLTLEEVLSSFGELSREECDGVKKFFQTDDQYWNLNNYARELVGGIGRGEIDLEVGRRKVETLIYLEGGRFDERDTDMIRAGLKAALLYRSKQG